MDKRQIVALILGLALGACDSPSSEAPVTPELVANGAPIAPGQTAPAGQPVQPAVQNDNTPSATPSSNTIDPAGVDPASANPASADPTSTTEANRDNAAENTNDTNQAHTTGAPLASVERGPSDTDERLTQSTLQRLYAAIGGPRPTFHGRAIRLTDNDQGAPRFAALVSAVVNEGGEAALKMRLWSVTLTDEEAQLVQELRMPVSHTLEFHEVSVGESPEGVEVLRFVSEDADADGEPEIQAVVRSGMAVLCGLGEITEREVFYINAGRGKALSLAASVQLRQSAAGRDIFRATTRLSDENGDGHPDLMVRSRQCPESEFIGECAQESVEVTQHLWDPEHDRWSEETARREVPPCDE